MYVWFRKSVWTCKVQNVKLLIYTNHRYIMHMMYMIFWLELKTDQKYQ